MPPDPEKVRRALSVAAQLVQRDGEKFLPVFLAIEGMAEALDGSRVAVARAQAIAAARAA